jgi:prophage antirepressor-like protein
MAGGQQGMNIIPFDYSGDEIRTIMQGGEPWFVGKDVCVILEPTNSTMALESLDGDERSMFNIGRQGEDVRNTVPVTVAIHGLDSDELASEMLNSGGQGREMKCALHQVGELSSKSRRCRITTI